MTMLIRIIETVTDIVSGYVQAWLTLGLMVLVMVDVVSRYVMKNPLAVSDEYGGFCLVAIPCIGLADAWKSRIHVRVEFVIKKLSIWKQQWLRFFTIIMGEDTIFAIGLLTGLLFLLFIGLEIAWSVGVIGLIGLMFFVNQSVDQIAYTMWDSLNSFALTAMPLFILMGNILGNTGINEKLFSAVNK